MEETSLSEVEVEMKRWERSLRHMQSAVISDFEHLQACLLQAADRFEDVANLIEKGEGYDPVPFLRASAERYRTEIEALKADPS